MEGAYQRNFSTYECNPVSLLYSKAFLGPCFITIPGIPDLATSCI